MAYQAIKSINPLDIAYRSFGASYYVDPTGSDSNPGTEARPWQTLAGAQTNVRSISSVTASAPINIFVGPGDYWLTSTLTFSTADSGTRSPINWVSRAGAGQAKIYGGTVVTGWTLHSGSIYKATVSSRVTTMWEDGVRARNARFPAYAVDATYPMAQAPYLNTTGVDTSQTVVQYGAGDLSPASWDTNSARVCLWPGGVTPFGATSSRSWFMDRIPISSIDAGSRQLTMGASALYSVYAGGVGGRYFCDGDLSFLVGPGQFYCDATNNTLYYWFNGSPTTSQVVIPAMDNTVSFLGDSSGSPVKNITFDGFEIQYADGVQTYTQTPLSAYDAQDKGIVRMQNADSIILKNCNIHNGGNIGVQMFSAVNQCQVYNSWVHGTGGYGIRMENYPGIAPDIGDVNHTNSITSVKVSQVGEIYGGGSCIFISNSGGNMVTHCDLSQAPRAGVEIVGGSALTSSNMYVKGNKVQYTTATKTIQDSGDMGTYYVNQTLNNGQTWNQLITTYSAANSSMTDYPPSAVMADNNASGQTYTNINGSNIQGTIFQDNAGGHTISNVFWLGGFNPAAMDPTIGLYPTNPWA